MSSSDLELFSATNVAYIPNGQAHTTTPLQPAKGKEANCDHHSVNNNDSFEKEDDLQCNGPTGTGVKHLSIVKECLPVINNMRDKGRMRAKMSMSPKKAGPMPSTTTAAAFSVPIRNPTTARKSMNALTVASTNERVRLSELAKAAQAKETADAIAATSVVAEVKEQVDEESNASENIKQHGKENELPEPVEDVEEPMETDQGTTPTVNGDKTQEDTKKLIETSLEEKPETTSHVRPTPPKAVPKARKSCQSASSAVIKNSSVRPLVSASYTAKASPLHTVTLRLKEIERTLGIKSETLSKIDAKTLDKLILEKAKAKSPSVEREVRSVSREREVMVTIDGQKIIHNRASSVPKDITPIRIKDSIPHTDKDITPETVSVSKESPSIKSDKEDTPKSIKYNTSNRTSIANSPKASMPKESSTNKAAKEITPKSAKEITSKRVVKDSLPKTTAPKENTPSKAAPKSTKDSTSKRAAKDSTPKTTASKGSMPAKATPKSAKAIVLNKAGKAKTPKKKVSKGSPSNKAVKESTLKSAKDTTSKQTLKENATKSTVSKESTQSKAILESTSTSKTPKESRRPSVSDSSQSKHASISKESRRGSVSDTMSNKVAGVSKENLQGSGVSDTSKVATVTGKVAKETRRGSVSKEVVTNNTESVQNEAESREKVERVEQQESETDSKVGEHDGEQDMDVGEVSAHSQDGSLCGDKPTGRKKRRRRMGTYNLPSHKKIAKKILVKGAGRGGRRWGQDMETASLSSVSSSVSTLVPPQADEKDKNASVMDEGTVKDERHTEKGGVACDKPSKLTIETRHEPDDSWVDTDEALHKDAAEESIDDGMSTSTVESYNIHARPPIRMTIKGNKVVKRKRRRGRGFPAWGRGGSKKSRRQAKFLQQETAWDALMHKQVIKDEVQSDAPDIEEAQPAADLNGQQLNQPQEAQLTPKKETLQEQVMSP